MEYFKHVENAFDKELFSLFGDKPDLFNFISNHERKNTLFANLKSEIFAAELRSAKLINLKNLEFIGKSFAKTFSKLAIEAEEKKYTSENEIQRRMHEAHRFKEMQDLVEESSNDYLEEVRVNGQRTRTKI